MRRAAFRRLLPALPAAALLLLAACGTLPEAGPLVHDIEDEAALKRRFPYEYVVVTPEIADIIAEAPPEPASEFAVETGAQTTLIAAGDQVSVTIVEAGAGGLFSAPPSNGIATGEPGARVVTLPETTVDQAGRIMVPFAGARKVAGLTTTQAAQALQAALAGQAINPQVTVSLTRGTGTRVVVAGAVHNPGLHVPQADGETLLEAIAVAGGAVDAPSDTVVQLNRNGLVHRIRMQAMLDNPQANIHVRNGDYLHVYSQPQLYTILGAADKPADGQLPQVGLSLAQAISRAGGLLDARADAAGVLLARYEPRETMDRIWAVEIKEARLHGQDLSAEIAGRAARLKPDAPVPVLFRVDMSRGTGLFLARAIAMRERDVVFLANATATEIGKAFDQVRLRFNIGTITN